MSEVCGYFAGAWHKKHFKICGSLKLVLTTASLEWLRKEVDLRSFISLYNRETPSQAKCVRERDGIVNVVSLLWNIVDIDCMLPPSGFVKHKNWSIHKWRFFNKASNIRNQIFWFYWIQFTSSIYVTILQLNVLKMNFLIYKCTVLCTSLHTGILYKNCYIDWRCKINSIKTERFDGV